MVATTPPYEEKPTYEQLIERAERCLMALSKGYVADAQVFARWILTDGKAALENLEATQKRCTELVEEARGLRESLAAAERIGHEVGHEFRND